VPTVHIRENLKNLVVEADGERDEYQGIINGRTRSFRNTICTGNEEGPFWKSVF
jgi:hypothetical protein